MTKKLPDGVHDGLTADDLPLRVLAKPIYLAPPGYTKLPAGDQCMCVRAWRNGDDHYCGCAGGSGITDVMRGIDEVAQANIAKNGGALPKELFRWAPSGALEVHLHGTWRYVASALAGFILDQQEWLEHWKAKAQATRDVELELRAELAAVRERWCPIAEDDPSLQAQPVVAD